jgi:hypothetical protein
MPFLEYVLLAILRLAPAAAPAPAGTSSGPPIGTLTADSITQPSGGSPVAVAGIALVGQDTAGCHGRKVGGTGKKPPRHLASRRYPRKVTGRNTNGGVKPNMNQQPRPPRPRPAPSNSNKNSK